MAMSSLREMLFGLERLDFFRKRHCPTECAKICNHKNYKQIEFLLSIKEFVYKSLIFVKNEQILGPMI